MLFYRSSWLTLADRIWPYSTHPESIRPVALAALGACLLIIGARLKIPLNPVPITMQSFFGIMIGLVYGMRLGSVTVLLYLMAGMAGLPVFANTPEQGVGVLYMLGPTGGYLVGYLVAAATTGHLAQRGFDRSFTGAAFAMLLGHVVIFVFGVSWLAWSLNLDVAQSWGLGIAPFLPGMVFKIALGTAAMPLIWKSLSLRPRRREA
jgi:biotin transport system substrate-specific component